MTEVDAGTKRRIDAITKKFSQPEVIPAGETDVPFIITKQIPPSQTDFAEYYAMREELYSRLYPWRNIIDETEDEDE